MFKNRVIVGKGVFCTHWEGDIGNIPNEICRTIANLFFNHFIYTARQ